MLPKPPRLHFPFLYLGAKCDIFIQTRNINITGAIASINHIFQNIILLLSLLLQLTGNFALFDESKESLLLAVEQKVN